jgi:hypothetical protein
METEGRNLALPSDGSPARDVLAGTPHMVRAAQATPLFLWGVIDAGGLRIATDLEDARVVALHTQELAGSQTGEGTEAGHGAGDPLVVTTEPEA